MLFRSRGRCLGPWPCRAVARAAAGGHLAPWEAGPPPARPLAASALAAEAPTLSQIEQAQLEHLLLQVSGASDPARAAKVWQVVGGGPHEKLAETHLAREIAKDWEALRGQFGLDEDELGLALHLVLRAMGEAACAGRRVFPDEASRTAFEHDFQNDCVRSEEHTSELQSRQYLRMPSSA